MESLIPLYIVNKTDDIDFVFAAHIPYHVLYNVMDSLMDFSGQVMESQAKRISEAQSGYLPR